MEKSQRITSKLVVTYWQCPRKAFLLLDGTQEAIPHELESIVDKCRTRSRNQYFKRMEDKFGEVSTYTHGALGNGSPALSVAELEYEDLYASADILLKVDSGRRRRKVTYTPVLAGGTHSVTPEDGIALTFVGVVLSHLQQHPCTAGKVLTNDGRTHSVKFGKRVRQVQAIISVLRSWVKEATPSPPDVILNKHCPLCPFREHCRAKALQVDHLSLMPGLGQKQIQEYNKKGIFTVTQLAYTYRARKQRRRNSHQQLQYKHPLKALAIRDNRTYVVETKQLDHPQPYIFLDVEGIPERRFYYLIGLLVTTGSVEIQHSFWADREDDERLIWRQFLEVVAALDDFTIFHYGNYEGQFIDTMARRYGDEHNPVVRKIKSRLTNVLGLIYGRIYFPTYSNGLKDIGAHFGCQWTHPDASGLQSIVWRHRWEESKAEKWKNALITYNQDDCRAAKWVSEAVVRTLQGHNSPNVATVDSIKSESPYKFGKADFVLPDFEHMNNCAYYDYQRDRVYFRSTARNQRQSTRTAKSKERHYPINKYIEIPAPERCQHCYSALLYRHGPQQKLVYDIRFTKAGVKRWVIQYRTERVRCRLCLKVSVSQEYLAIHGKSGHDLYSLITYNSIALQQSFSKTLEVFGVLFGYDIGLYTCVRARRYFAELYDTTYQSILANLRQGQVVHVDETMIKIGLVDYYVWVFTSTTEVAYVLSPTRESDVPKQHLKGFAGVLISDFFSAYDPLECRKQRCLVHLIRDMNDDLCKNPFDVEFKSMLQNFGALMRSVLSTIDRFGLRKRYLHKHRKDVDRFYRNLVATTFHTDAAVQCKDRLIRWKDELFTFLEFDGVPWNNNNAEHAVKTIALRRKAGSGFFTEAGVRRLLVLLSVYETCRYREINFLEFLRTGRTDLLNYPSPLIRPTGNGGIQKSGVAESRG